MNMKWLVNTENNTYQINLSTYSSLFIDYSTNLDSIIDPILQYFQSKSKLKNSIVIKDILQDYDEINYRDYLAIKLSNQIMSEETTLGSKTLMKDQIKMQLINNIETDGYMLTINTLLQDLLGTGIDNLPIKTKPLTVDSIMKLIELDINLENSSNESNKVLNQNKILLPIIKSYLINKYKSPLLLFFVFPEDLLSPREQLEMKELLMSITEQINVFVITKSNSFLSDEFDGNNYYKNGRQLITKELIHDLEWESPLPFTQDELKLSFLFIMRKYIELIELSPTVSNYKQSDVILFKSIDLYVFVFVMRRLKLNFSIELTSENVDKPVFEYIMDVYEKM
ncbi:hypothetical protein NC797_14590 [Aquibacillus sp. 3ASR75-11]|uniref:Uncharacterized protein n=1 Tax=Terrihalobacillus insolitus TaxID=2950438 RepID=A0A9X3WTX2_9BACI|nr:hypothetical protein [Terrihalobacillus insolitus]MDC3425732.1 hypothetical protein [Terrihalobacillus insolitus]